VIIEELEDLKALQNIVAPKARAKSLDQLAGACCQNVENI